MFKKHKQKRNFRLRMQDTMLVLCILYFVFNYVYTLCIFNIIDDSRYLLIRTQRKMLYYDLCQYFIKLN